MKRPVSEAQARFLKDGCTTCGHMRRSHYPGPPALCRSCEKSYPQGAHHPFGYTEATKQKVAEDRVVALEAALREGIRYVDSSSYPLQVSGVAGGWCDRVRALLSDRKL